jgi:hypothetical protein
LILPIPPRAGARQFPLPWRKVVLMALVVTMRGSWDRQRPFYALRALCHSVCRGDLSARIKSFWERRAQHGVSQTQLLKLQIEKAEAQIRRLDQLLTDPMTPLSAETERRYIESLRETEADAQRLRAA